MDIEDNVNLPPLRPLGFAYNGAIVARLRLYWYMVNIYNLVKLHARWLQRALI